MYNYYNYSISTYILSFEENSIPAAKVANILIITNLLKIKSNKRLIYKHICFAISIIDKSVILIVIKIYGIIFFSSKEKHNISAIVDITLTYIVVSIKIFDCL